MNIIPGRASPSQTLPPGGGRGKPGFSIPLRGGGVGKPGFPTPLLQQPMFTFAVHAAPPHNAAMNIRFFLGGRSPPGPSRGQGNGETGFPHSPAGRGRGETRFPHTLAPAAYVHVSRPCGSAAHEQDENRFFLGGRSPPKPSRGRGYGGTWFPHVHVSVWHTTKDEVKRM